MIWRRLEGFSKKLKLNPNTKFLAIYLAGNYLRAAEDQGYSFEECFMEAVYGSLFVASKMRERDIHCPLVPHVIHYSEEASLTEKRLKSAEFKICSFYNWNLSMMSYYDYLEHYLTLGALLETDKIKLSANEIIGSSTRGTCGRSTLELTEDLSRGSPLQTHEFNQENSQIGVDSKSPVDYRGYDSSGSTPYTVKGAKIVKISGLSPQNTSKIALEIEKTALNLAELISCNYYINPFLQREAAYLILLLSRKHCGIAVYDSSQLKKLYDFDETHIDKLNIALLEIAKEGIKPNGKEFDLGLRYYDDNGKEISFKKWKSKAKQSQQESSSPINKIIIEEPIVKEKRVASYDQRRRSQQEEVHSIEKDYYKTERKRQFSVHIKPAILVNSVIQEESIQDQASLIKKNRSRDVSKEYSLNENSIEFRRSRNVPRFSSRIVPSISKNRDVRREPPRSIDKVTTNPGLKQHIARVFRPTTSSKPLLLEGNPPLSTSISRNHFVSIRSELSNRKTEGFGRNSNLNYAPKQASEYATSLQAVLAKYGKRKVDSKGYITEPSSKKNEAEMSIFHLDTTRREPSQDHLYRSRQGFLSQAALKFQTSNHLITSHPASKIEEQTGRRKPSLLYASRRNDSLSQGSSTSQTKGGKTNTESKGVPRLSKFLNSMPNKDTTK